MWHSGIRMTRSTLRGVTETKQDWQHLYVAWLWWFTDDNDTISLLLKKCQQFGLWNHVYESVWIYMGILEHSDWWTERTSWILWRLCQWRALVKCVCILKRTWMVSLLIVESGNGTTVARHSRNCQTAAFELSESVELCRITTEKLMCR